MKERTYCTGKWQGGCHRTYECGVRALCEKYIALQKYLEKNTDEFALHRVWNDTYSDFHNCERDISDRAEEAARNSFTWLGPTSM
jgi:hypothetical protein